MFLLDSGSGTETTWLGLGKRRSLVYLALSPQTQPQIVLMSRHKYPVLLPPTRLKIVPTSH